MSPLKNIRQKLGVTQQELADAIGVTQGNIGHYERGQPIPAARAVLIMKFAEKRNIHVSMDDIYGLGRPSKKVSA